MAEARKCDRCGSLFELSKFDLEHRDYPYNLKGTYVVIYLKGCSDEPAWYDLCPTCMEKLEKWLKEPFEDSSDPYEEGGL